MKKFGSQYRTVFSSPCFLWAYADQKSRLSVGAIDSMHESPLVRELLLDFQKNAWFLLTATPDYLQRQNTPFQLAFPHCHHQDQRCH